MNLLKKSFSLCILVAFALSFSLIASSKVQAADNNWSILSEKNNVSLDKSWTITFTRELSNSEIDAIVIDKDNIFVPTSIKLFPSAKKIVIQPMEAYLPNTKYNLKVFLNNGEKYKMSFTTVDKDTVINTERGNTIGNTVNEGIVAEKDGWFYYSNPTDENRLYKLNLATGQKQKLSDNKPEYINVMGGFVYYCINNQNKSSSLYKVRIDGTEDTELIHESSYYCYYINVIDRMIYTGNDSNDVNIYGTDGSKMNSLYINKEYGSCSPIYGKWIYFRSDEGKLCKITIDKNDYKILSDDKASFINIFGDWIYYINKDDSKIYKIKTDGTNRICLTDDFTECLNVSDSWIYYVNSENRFMYRMQLDGTKKQQISNDASSQINIAGGWIYYINPVSKIEYRMKLDGSDWQPVN